MRTTNPARNVFVDLALLACLVFLPLKYSEEETKPDPIVSDDIVMCCPQPAPKD